MKSIIRVLLAAAALLNSAALNAGAGETLPPAKHEPIPAVKFMEKFKQVSPDALLGILAKHGQRPGLATGGNAASYNSMTIGWFTFGILWGKPVNYVYVHPDRFTWRFFETERIYTVSFYDTAAANKAVMEIFGRKSGRNTDKEKESGFTPAVTPAGGVSYMEASVVIVCRQLAKASFKEPAFKEFGDTQKTAHTEYIGEILEIWVRQ